jgi:hypothetical protein
MLLIMQFFNFRKVINFMKKYILALPIFLLLIFHMFIVPVKAEPKVLKEGFYKAENLNLSKGVHTVQNNSSSDYAFIAVFDSNQVTRQYMKLTPQSEKYILVPLDAGYEIIISSNSDVTIE